MRLSATKVKALSRPGRYTDGQGLHLFIGKTGKKSWVQRITVDGKRRDFGLGGFPAVSLAEARERSAAMRADVAEGKDPLVEKRKPSRPTLREAAYTVHRENKPRWRNEKHAAAWIHTLERYAFPLIGNKRIDKIGRTDVLAVLNPIWSTKPETARRVRQRLRTIFRWAMAYGLIDVNPAGEAINGALPSMPKVKAHFRAMPYEEVSSALETVEASQASRAAKLCLRFLVLTSVRSGEARGATWSEIDLRGRVWRIPSRRMKAGSEHRVPLSRQAVGLLNEASALRDETDLVFPSPQRHGGQLSDMTLTKVLRSIGMAERATVHGFRSSFKNWTLEQMDVSSAVSEAALIHTLGNSTEQAYARSELFERHRDLMQKRAHYVTGKLQDILAPDTNPASDLIAKLYWGRQQDVRSHRCLGVHPCVDVALPPPDGSAADLYGLGEFAGFFHSIDGRAAQACLLLNISTPQKFLFHSSHLQFSPITCH